MTTKLFQGSLTAQNFPHAYAFLTDILSSPNFLANQGLNNDIPFHICPFQPAIRQEVMQLIRQLINYLHDNGITVLEINLYELAIEILKAKGDWAWLQENETSLSRAELKEELQALLDVETVLAPAMAKRIAAADFEVLFISGVGEVFPYIRSHNVLNNLQRYAKTKPTLLFFPVFISIH